MPNLQRRCSVHPDHPVDTCQGAVNFLTGAEPLGALWALCGSEVEEAAMSFEINYILRGQDDPPCLRLHRGEKLRASNPTLV